MIFSRRREFIIDHGASFVARALIIGWPANRACNVNINNVSGRTNGHIIKLQISMDVLTFQCSSADVTRSFRN